MAKSKKMNVLKHFNDKFDSRVKEVTKSKKKFMDGGTAGVVNNYNDIKYGTSGANPGTGKSYMSGNPAPAFKKGGLKKYQTKGEVKNPSRTPGTRVDATPSKTTTWVVNNPSDTATVRYGDSKLTVNDKGQPKRYSKRKLGGSTNKKK